MSKTTQQPQQLAETPVHGVVWLDWEEWQTLQAFMGKADGSDTTVADLLGEIENRFFVKHTNAVSKRTIAVIEYLPRICQSITTHPRRAMRPIIS